MDVYYITENNRIVHLPFSYQLGNNYYCAFLNKEHAIFEKNKLEAMFDEHDKYKIRKCSFPFIGKYLRFTEVYLGFDYDFGGHGIIDVVEKSETLYATIDDLKKNDKLYLKYKNIALDNPDMHIITDDIIASKDVLGNPFIYGNVFEDNFNMKIKKVRVYRFND